MHDIIKTIVLFLALALTIDLSTTVLSWYSKGTGRAALSYRTQTWCALFWAIFYYLCNN